MKWLTILLVLCAATSMADVGERYQDYVKRHPTGADSAPRDEGGLWRIRHKNGPVNILLTIFDGVICEERHYPVSRAQADALVAIQGRGTLKLSFQGIDEVRWSTEDNRLAGRFSAKGRYFQISNPRQVEERMAKVRKAEEVKVSAP